MVCTKCGKPLRQGADSCPSCGQNTDALAGTRAARTGPRPGGKPRISDEGIIHGTDGKYRWVHETDLWREPGVMVGSVVKFALIGAAVGLLGAAVMGPAAVLTAAVVGALAGLGVHAANAAANAGKRCEMYTLDESCLLCQQVDGRVSKQKVIQVIGD